MYGPPTRVAMPDDSEMMRAAFAHHLGSGADAGDHARSAGVHGGQPCRAFLSTRTKIIIATTLAMAVTTVIPIAMTRASLMTWLSLRCVGAGTVTGLG